MSQNTTKSSGCFVPFKRFNDVVEKEPYTSNLEKGNVKIKKILNAREKSAKPMKTLEEKYRKIKNSIDYENKFKVVKTQILNEI